MFKSYSQQQVLDSLRYAYSKQTSDTDKLRTVWNIVDYYSEYRADSALLFAEQNLALAEKINSHKYRSLSLKQIGDAYRALGEYPAALNCYLRRLEMDEKEKDPYKRAITLNSIANVYGYENDYDRALQYMLKAEKIIDSNHLNELKSLIYVNLCDAYEKMGNLPQAFICGKKSLQEAEETKDTIFIGVSYNNIANVFARKNEAQRAIEYYRLGIPFLQASGRYNTLCETYNGISQLMQQQNIDSAIYYSELAATLAKKLKLNKFYLQSCNLLNHYFADTRRFDSAYYYQSQAMILKDSVFNDENAKHVQLLTMKEDIRQREIAEATAKTEEEHKRKLQLLAIGLLIPVFFVITIIISKRKINVRVVEFTGILSLLILFEYIALLIHPAIANLTNNSPIYEIIVLILLALILTPLHHRTEQWLIGRLTLYKKEHIKTSTKKIHQKKLG